MPDSIALIGIAAVIASVHWTLSAHVPGPGEAPATSAANGGRKS